MKVLAISGSARRDGNTAALVRAVFAPLNASGIDTELVQLAGETIEPCRACWGCDGAGNCAHVNDIFYELFDKMVAADGIILASPVYAGSVSSSLQAVIERASVVCDMNRDAGFFRGRAAAAIVSARRGGAVSALHTLTNFFLLNGMYTVGAGYWPIAYGRLPGEVNQDAEGMQTMRELGSNMARLMIALDGSKS